MARPRKSSRVTGSRRPPHASYDDAEPQGTAGGRRPGRPKKLREGLISSPLRPKTENQKDYFESILHNDITLCDGPAGSGKTAIATYLALEMLIKGKVKKIIITRPALEVGKSIGFLPGKIEDKMRPYLTPILDCISDFSSLPELLDRIEFGSLTLMRGRTFKNAFVLLDEASNCTKEDLKMFITRLGEGSKMVINGDIMQSDLPSHLQGGLEDYMDKLEGIDGIGVIGLLPCDIQRHPLIEKILARIAPEDFEDKK